MLEFSCDCGRKLKVSNDLAGWQTQCPGCQRLIPVPGLQAPTPVAAAPQAVAEFPWKGIAIGASSVALIALLILVATAGGSKSKPDEETERTISRLKKQVADQDQEIESLNAEREKPRDLAKATDRAVAAEKERDRLKGQLDATLRQLDEHRMRTVKAETETPKPQAPPPPVAVPEKAEAPPPKDPPPPAKAPPAAEAAATPDHPKGIKINGFVTKFIVDDERDRIVGVDTKNQGVFVASISKRKVLRTITTGSGPTDLQFPVNPDVAWVGHPAAGHLVKVEVEEGRIYDRVNVTAGFQHYIATRNHIWTFGKGNSGIITINDKEQTVSPLRFGSLVFDRRRDLLVGIALNLGDTKMIEIDPDKAGPLLRAIQEIKSGGNAHPRQKELPDLSKELENRMKSWAAPAECVDWMVQGFRFSMVMNKGADRVYLNRSILKRDKLDAVLATFPPAAVTRPLEPEVHEALEPYVAEASLIQCGSANGKWIATGTHIYSTEKFAVHKELPIPTVTSAFSSDSKTLYIFDVRSKSIIPVDVE